MRQKDIRGVNKFLWFPEMDEFALCWKNFQDNIADGFHGLWMRGDLVDVTLACDGKLLHAHKIVRLVGYPDYPIFN